LQEIESVSSDTYSDDSNDSNIIVLLPPKENDDEFMVPEFSSKPLYRDMVA